jgi:peroxiredoxin
MKTLKILTGLLLGALAIAIASGMLHSRDRENLYATPPVPKQYSIKESLEENKTPIRGYGIGDVATDFSLKNVDGDKISLENYKQAKGFVLLFTCNHCPYSVAYEDRIIALDKKYKNLGYPVIAINPNNPKEYPTDSFELMKVRAREKGFSFPYLLDEGQKIYPQYGATKTPHVFLLQKENNEYIVKYIGAIDDNYQDATAVKNNYLEKALQSLLRGEGIALTKSVAIGCRIK